MITVEKFVFNPFQVNTYLLIDETGNTIIIDPGCADNHECNELAVFISGQSLRLQQLVYTHCHVDHVAGNHFVCDTYGLKPLLHREGLPFFLKAHEHGKIYGFQLTPAEAPDKFLEHGDIIKLGENELEVRYTPGHVDGHIVLVNHADHFVITGDVLFRDSIGRTDFETGDFDLLMKSIHEQLFTLPDDYTVYCGHGPETSIGYEKVNNPFIRF
ncbi:MAG: MBL fold metallo-hydrolase [Bacteroidales bacterium]